MKKERQTELIQNAIDGIKADYTTEAEKIKYAQIIVETAKPNSLRSIIQKRLDAHQTQIDKSLIELETMFSRDLKIATCEAIAEHQKKVETLQKILDYGI